MAKAAAKKTTKVTAKAKPGRLTATKKPVKAAPVKAAVVSKDELRAQLEKAQTTIATLRGKAREATRAAKTSAAHIAELEATVAKLGKTSATSQKTAAPAGAKPARPRGRKPAKKPELETPAEPGDTDLPEDDSAAFD